MRDRGAENRGVARACNRVEVVDEAPLAAEQSLVLEAQKGTPDPGRRLDRHAHRTTLHSLPWGYGRT
jgi:hypothetical protein